MPDLRKKRRNESVGNHQVAGAAAILAYTIVANGVFRFKICVKCSYELLMVQTVGLDLPTNRLAGLDFDNHYWLVLHPGIPGCGSPLALGE